MSALSEDGGSRRAGESALIRLGGLSYAAGAVGFVVVFSYLAARFGYPEVLDGSAGEVLPRLLAMGESGRAVWAVYAVLPLVLVPGSVGAFHALRQDGEAAMRLAMLLGTVAALGMTVGLARWPSLHWELALAFEGAAPAQRELITALFAGANSYLGNYLGEFVGELSLYGSSIVIGAVMLRGRRFPRGVALLGIATGTLGWVAMFRNVWDGVDRVSSVVDYLLPVWLLALGLSLALAPGGRRLSPAGAPDTPERQGVGRVGR